jgi:hypothetical protein
MNQQAVDTLKAERDAIKHEYMAHAEKMDREYNLLSKKVEALSNLFEQERNTADILAKENKVLREALIKIADWDAAWGYFSETNPAWSTMAIITARELTHHIKE